MANVNFKFDVEGAKMIKKWTYYDQKSGEVFCEKKQYVNPAFNEEKGYLFWNRKDSSKTFKEIHFPDKMSWEDIGRLTVLTKYIFSNTNMLGYRGNGCVKPYGVTKIAEIIKLSEQRTGRYLSKLIGLGVMAKVKVTIQDKTEYQYYINPLYFFSSNYMPLNLYLLFRKQLDNYLPTWVKQKFSQQEKG